MKFRAFSRVIVASLAGVLAFSSFPAAQAQSPSEDSPITGKGYLQTEGDAYSPLELKGNSPDLGDYSCYAQIHFTPGARKGEQDGEGVAVFQTASGDQIVSDVNWVTDSDGTGEIEFVWRDSVVLDDGTVVPSTGVYKKGKPKNGKGKSTGIHVTIAIIAILISS